MQRGTDETPDASFWRVIFESFRPHLSIHVKSVGSRRVAEEIARMAAEAAVHSVCVCTDADVDIVAPARALPPTQVTTWGYSWESDIADFEVLRCVFIHLRGFSLRSQEQIENLRRWHNEFVASCLLYTQRDIRRVRSGLPGVFEREQPTRNLGLAQNLPPDLESAFLDQRLEIEVEEGFVFAHIEENTIEPQRHCFGKLLIRACYHATSHFMHRVRRGRIDFDTFVDLAIACLRDAFAATPDKREYYDRALPLAT
jgi:hypothetical protein